MPEMENFYYDCFQPISRAVQGFVPYRAEVMIAAGNVKGAIRYLGGSETDNIMDLVRSRFLEDLEEANHKITRYSRRNNQSQVTEWTEKRNRIQRRLDELEERLKADLEGTCNICFEAIDEPALVPCCQQIFCCKCIMTWLPRTPNCPLCRSPIQPKDLTLISEKEGKQEKKKNQPLTKLQQIIEIIRKTDNGKFIIFSEEDATFGLIRSEFVKAKILCKEIKGRSESREKLIKGFKEGKYPVIFLNSRNNGAGINLQECSDVILYHTMTPTVETQILGRANRIGRTKKLRVHHLRVST